MTPLPPQKTAPVETRPALYVAGAEDPCPCLHGAVAMAYIRLLLGMQLPCRRKSLASRCGGRPSLQNRVEQPRPFSTQNTCEAASERLQNTLLPLVTPVIAASRTAICCDRQLTSPPQNDASPLGAASVSGRGPTTLATLDVISVWTLLVEVSHERVGCSVTLSRPSATDRRMAAMAYGAASPEKNKAASGDVILICTAALTEDAPRPFIIAARGLLSPVAPTPIISKLSATSVVS